MSRERSSGESTEKTTESEDARDESELAIAHGNTFGKAPCRGGQDDGGGRGMGDAANDGFRSIEFGLRVQRTDQLHAVKGRQGARRCDVAHKMVAKLEGPKSGYGDEVEEIKGYAISPGLFRSG